MQTTLIHILFAAAIIMMKERMNYKRKKKKLQLTINRASGFTPVIALRLH